ncbi:MAG TPA: S-layer homology domain-containing protein [Firmicutes bacterium]|nr:S-layer homology domain-containing protein [Candidatus Fermentithermobacillaceae bacterium]
MLCYSREGSTGPAFTDLQGYDWARDSIELLASQGILKGVGEGRFEPGGVVTREQFAALVERLFTLRPQCCSTRCGRDSKTTCQSSNPRPL